MRTAEREWSLKQLIDRVVTSLAPQLAIVAEGTLTKAAIAGTNDAAMQARPTAAVLIDAALRK